MAKVPHVALLMDTSISFQRQALHGIAQYARGRSGAAWSIYVEQEPAERIPNLKKWHGDGMIVAIRSRTLAAALAELPIPVVAVGGLAVGQAFPAVSSDSAATGRMGAEHLLDRGFTRFAYCGLAATPVTHYSADREIPFIRRVRERGHPCVSYEARRATARNWDGLQMDLAAWLASLDKPVGVMACNDTRARHVLEACRESGLDVPHEVAVLGVDNDALMCELSNPPLSSIDLAGDAIGYQAAALLDRLMAGQAAPAKPMLIAPRGVVARQSTDVLAMEDRHVARAVRFIRERACEGIGVDDVVADVPVARRALERRFRQILGRSPHAEIRRVQIARAKELLARTELTVERIARQSGFRYVQYMRQVFRRTTGLTPGQYRKQSRV